MRRSPLRHLSSSLGLLVVLASAGGWTTLGAQVASSAPSGSPTDRPCYDSIPPSAFSRVVAYASIDGDSLPKATERSILFGADGLLQAVVERTRAILGATDDVLPRGEPLLGDSTHVWRAASRDLLLVAHRDGRVAARVDSVGKDSAAALLLRRALSEVTAGGEPFIWPDDAAAAALDSVRLRIALTWATVDSARRPRPLEHRRPLLPVFSMLAPWEEPVQPRKMARVEYPEAARNKGYVGSTLLQFVVDGSGRPDMSTLRDLNAARARTLPGESREAYDAFVRATRDAVGRARYTPARIGGCAVRQLVQQPFTFQMR